MWIERVGDWRVERISRKLQSNNYTVGREKKFKQSRTQKIAGVNIACNGR